MLYWSETPSWCVRGFVTHPSILFICTLLTAIYLSFRIKRVAYDIKAQFDYNAKASLAVFLYLELMYWKSVRSATNNLSTPPRATILSRALQVWLWRSVGRDSQCTSSERHELRAGSVAGSAPDCWMATFTCDMEIFLCCIIKTWCAVYV